jgi:hypothetical protein
MKAWVRDIYWLMLSKHFTKRGIWSRKRTAQIIIKEEFRKT